jgi:hypothetical protein
MTRSHFRFLASALLGAALLGGAGAQARAIYTGTFDPAYGSPFGNLGWRGTAVFEVDTGCLPTVGFSGVVATTVGGGCSADVTAATVNFYILPGSTDKARITYAAPDVPVAISRLLYSGGALVGVQTGLFDSLAPVALDGTTTGDMVTMFGNNVPTFALDFDLGPTYGDGRYNGPRLYWTRGQGSGCINSTCNGDNDPLKVPTFVITARDGSGPVSVPEPGSLLLTAAALLAAGAAARRRR